MRIRSLKLSHFRNLPALALQVPAGAGLVGLVGANGSGKTSVLEAISLLTPTRGLLGAEGRAQVRHGAKEWGLWAQLSDETEIGAVYRKGSRQLQINAQPAQQADLTRHGSVIWLTPATDFLFGGPPAARRRWLDDLVTSLIPHHANAVSRFRQHRQARLRLLAQGQGGDWLDAEERLAAEWGVQVLIHRREYLQQLAPYLNNLTLELHGAAVEVLDQPDPVATLKGKFERSRDIDARLQRTHAGPNTADLAGQLQVEEGRQVAMAHASSGQHKRGLVMALLAHVRLMQKATGKPPLVLIDEFSAHLDATRRRALTADLLALGCQVWFSDTEAPATGEAIHIITLSQAEEEARPLKKSA